MFCLVSSLDKTPSSDFLESQVTLDTTVASVDSSVITFAEFLRRMQALENAPVEDDEAELELQMALARSRKMKMKKEPDEISAPEMVCVFALLGFCFISDPIRP